MDHVRVQGRFNCWPEIATCRENMGAVPHYHHFLRPSVHRTDLGGDALECSGSRSNSGIGVDAGQALRLADITIRFCLVTAHGVAALAAGIGDRGVGSMSAICQFCQQV